MDACLQARKIEKEQDTRTRAAPPPMKTEMKPAFNPKPAFILATRGTPPAVPRPSPAPAHVGPMPMELDSQYRRMSQEEHDRCINRELCFTCNEYGHVSTECPKRRVRITEIEMELGKEEGRAGNDDAQE